MLLLVDEVQSMVKEIIAVDTGNDFINYEIKDMEPIAEHREYRGVRVQLAGRIKSICENKKIF